MLGKNGNRLCNSNFSINASTREKIKFGLIEALNLKDNTTFFNNDALKEIFINGT